MKIEQDIVASLVFEVKTTEGNFVDKAPIEDPLDYLHGYSDLISGLEAALDGKTIGDKFSITLAAEDAYGEYNDNLVQRVPANIFESDEKVEVGMQFMADTDQGQIPIEVTEVDGDEVVVDGNHMLAGQALVFDVEVVALRKGTAEEIEHGHVHASDDEEHECCGGEHKEGEGCGSGKGRNKKDGCCGNGECAE